MQYQNIEDAFESLYNFTISNLEESLIEEAKMQFIKTDDASDIDGFNEWLIFEYMNSETGKTFSQRYNEQEKSALSKALLSSYRSLFDVKITEKTIELKDLLTKDSLFLDELPGLTNGITSIRIMQLDDTYYGVGDIVTYEASYQAIIIKHILEQYNQYVASNGPIALKAFLKENGYLFYKINSAIHDLEAYYLEEEDYELHHATYAFNMTKEALLDLIESLDGFVLEKDEDEEDIYHLSKEQRIIAEIEVEKMKVNFLCNHPEDLSFIIETLKTIENEAFVFIKQAVNTIEDFL